MNWQITKHDLPNMQMNCVSQFHGLWMIEPTAINTFISLLQQGINMEPKVQRQAEPGGEPERRERYYITPAGIGIINIEGPLMKGNNKYGFGNTVQMRREVRSALRNPQVREILLRIDSPGGSVAGIQDFADDVRLSNKQKRVTAYIEDLGASAAYWIASQAGKIVANKSAEIGSIGTVAVVADTSEMAEMAGIKIHVVSTGAYKGAFTQGTEITNEQIEYLQHRVNILNELFLQNVKVGRKLTLKQLENASDGRLFGALQAKDMRLVDDIQTWDNVLDDIEYRTQSMARVNNAILSRIGSNMELVD